MSVDTSMIALDDLIEREAGIRLGKEVGNGQKASRKGPCPFCKQGTDRFAVLVNELPQHYHCGIHGHGCGAHGDAVRFMTDYRGMEFFEACECLGVDPGLQYSGPSHRKAKNEDVPPSDGWQSAAMDFCTRCKDILWSDIGKNALAWLKARGFTEDTLKVAGIGYNPSTRWDEKEAWNVTIDDVKTVWLPRGIVIPWRIEGHLWKVSIRRPDPELAAQAKKWEAEGHQGKPAKYVAVTGGGNGLYGVDEIRQGQPLVVVEGEFDRLIFKQVTSNRVASVATGSTAKGREEKWTLAIGQADPVLVAFDYDAGGKKAYSEHWKQALAGAIRWAPWAHDLNDMHKQEMDLNEWLDTGIEVAGLPPIVPMAPAPPPAPVEVPTSGDYYHTIHQAPYVDIDGVEREYTVTYYSQEAEPDICFSPYFERLIDEIAIFEADPGLLQFDLYDTSKNDLLVAKYRKWRVGGGEKPAPAARVDIPLTNGTPMAPRPARKTTGIPSWLIPGSHDWEKQIRHMSEPKYGCPPLYTQEAAIEEMNERRAAWFAQQVEGKVVEGKVVE